MFHCGIDLASKTTALCVVDDRERVILERELPTDFGQIREVLAPYPGVSCVVESAPLAEHCRRELARADIECTIVDARAAKALFDARKKTDRRDAVTLARMRCSGWYQAVHPKSDEARNLRFQLGVRAAVVRTQVAVQNTVLGLLRSMGIRVTRGASLESRLRQVLDESPTLEAMLRPLLEQRALLKRQLQDLNRALGQQLRRHPVARRLVAVPGVGTITALAFVATIDDPTRFGSAKQVGDYVGLAPGIYQSGEIERIGRITRQGDVLLRSLLVEAANAVLHRCKQDWAWKDWALRLKERKGAGKARVALARRLACLLWKLWKDNVPFNPQPVAA